MNRTDIELAILKKLDGDVACGIFGIRFPFLRFFNDACITHDVYYTIGGDKEDRKLADRFFLTQAVKSTIYHNKHLSPTVVLAMTGKLLLSIVMYGFVRAFGWLTFYKRKAKTTDEALMRIDKNYTSEELETRLSIGEIKEYVKLPYITKFLPNSIADYIKKHKAKYLMGGRGAEKKQYDKELKNDLEQQGKKALAKVLYLWYRLFGFVTFNYGFHSYTKGSIQTRADKPVGQRLYDNAVYVFKT